MNYISPVDGENISQSNTQVSNTQAPNTQVSNTHASNISPVSANKKSVVRPATKQDIDLIHTRLMEAIDTSQFYSDEFKQYEKQNLNKNFLRSLFEIDPYHLMIFVADNETAGFMITSPQCGTIWLHWTYIFPEKRRASLIMAGFRSMVEHWDNGRFHKIATYTKPGNAVDVILKRYKFNLTCTLENHMFGEDYLLYERQLNKIIPGYDHGVGATGLKGHAKRFISSLLPIGR